MTTNHAEESLNPSAWNELQRDYLIQVAIKKVSDYQLAEDLVQDTFVAAWKARDRFRGDCSERTFLVSILRNKIIDFYRKRGRRKEVLENTLMGDSDSNDLNWIESMPDRRNDSNPLSSADQNEFESQLDTAINRLPKKMGSAFRLWQVNNLSTEEVTKHLNISTSNLWVLVHRARKILKDELSEWEGSSFLTAKHG